MPLLLSAFVDSRNKSVDDERTMHWFAPRRNGSNWSKSNKDRVVKLTKSGLMMPPGLARVEAAKRDGTWTALDAVENLEIPPDLELKFAENPGSARNFEAFPRWVKRSSLEWILTANRETTRARRIDETARLAQENQRPKQFR